ncbi:MAG: type II toxin-antitoxin system RelE/ParE family toxin [Acidobacteriia bacterium]|nr:type II toxin-antitoxin system RelE/ParE family toxin [Terriglobia bacterium]
MTRCQLLITPAALRDIEKRVPRKLRPAVERAIDKLRDEPLPQGAKPLHGVAGLYRIRVGDYRIVYSADRKAPSVTVEKVGHRKEVYRFLGR